MRKIRKIEPAAPLLVQKKKVAAYARVSMESERLMHSLSAQVSFYSSLIQGNPEWEYAGVYVDSGVSGTSMAGRTEFKRLLADCEAGRVNIILTKGISRFARNTVDLLETVRHLKELGVEVRFEKENINSLSEDGELMLTLLASFAQEESRSISENAKWAIRKQYKQGKARNGILYGYRIEKGQPAIEPEEAEVVRMIFESYLGGMSCYAIANELNARGIPSYYGKKWAGGVICQTIRQEKYTGNTLLQKFYVEEGSPRKGKRNNGELPMYYVEGTHPAIISREVFDRAQQEMAARYGVEVRNGRAEPAGYLYHGGAYEKPDYHFRRPQWTEEQRRRHAEMFTEREKAVRPLCHDLSLFIKCEVCGQNLTGQTRKFADGTRELRWVCFKHNKAPHAVGKARPPAMQDKALKKMTAEVLGMEEFDAGIMCERLSHISAYGDMLTFHFHDGHTEKRKYIPGKRGYRRKEGKPCREEG